MGILQKFDVNFTKYPIIYNGKNPALDYKWRTKQWEMSLICSNPKYFETKEKLPENIFVVVLSGGALQHGISLPLGKMAPVYVHIVRYFLL